MDKTTSRIRAVLLLLFTFGASSVFAGEADIHLPDLSVVKFGNLPGMYILYAGLLVCVIGTVFGLLQYQQTKNLPVHASMSAVSNIIWETCKTYLLQQGRFLVALWVLIAACMGYYFLGLQGNPIGHVLVI